MLTAVWLLLVVTSKDNLAVSTDSASIQGLSNLLSSSGEQIHSITMMIFSLGALMLYYLLFESELIPRWLSGWGFVASLIYLASGVWALFGTISNLALVPLGLQEMVMAVWLILKGFNPTANGSHTQGE
jgi:hypothetical protein